MKRGFWHRRIPTGAALLILVVSIVVTTLMVKQGAIFDTRAGPEKTPQNVIISNITDNSFTIAFTTTSPTIAGVSVEGSGSPFIVYDTRNKLAANQKSYFSHFITVADLSPKTNYNFSIISDGETFLDGGRKYSVTTGEKILSPPPVQNPIVGKIILPQGGAASDTIVSLEVGDAQKITALTNDSGNFIIPTNSIRSTDLAGYVKIQPDKDLTITALRQDLKTSLKVIFKNTVSLPPLTLAQNYDFTEVAKEADTKTTVQLKPPATQTASNEVRILTPKYSESFIDSRPVFRGTARPNQNVKISIQSDPIIATVRADANGNWSFRPTQPLLPGSHTITIQSVDRFGINRTLSQSFTIFSSGSQVAQTATPSATPIVTRVPSPIPTSIPSATPAITSLTPTISLSTTPTTTPSLSMTPSPTAAISITPTVTLIPTSVPTIILSPTSQPTQVPIITPVPTGSSTSILLTIVSIILIVSGSALLFLL